MDRNIWKQCENCSRRNCHKVPPKKTRCHKKIPMKEGFSFFEIATDNSPVEVATLLYDYKLEATWNGGKIKIRRKG